MTVRERGRVAGDSLASEYERHRGVVTGMLAKRFPRLDEDDGLAIYHDAWARVYAKRERGESIDSLRAYLLASAAADAMNAVSRRRPPTPVGPDDPLLAGLPDARSGVEDEVVARDQARIARDVLDSLDRRQRDVLKLRWDLQLSGEEIRAALGLSERQYHRLVEEGAAAVAERVRELESGAWSRRQRSLLTACLVRAGDGGGHSRRGIASERQRAEAQRLLESDPHVAALYVEVREALRGAAALLPLPVLLPAGGHGLAERLGLLLDHGRDALADLLSAGKHHATSLYVRAADPAAALGGSRPGATVAAVACCVAVGGGAVGTYVAVDASPPDRRPPPTTSAVPPRAPVQPAVRDTRPQAPDPSAPPSSRPARISRSQPDQSSQPHEEPRQPDAPNPTPTPEFTPQPVAPPTPAPTPKPPAPPATNTEFGFEE